MWNNYWSGRTRRDVPQVDYHESSEEEEFELGTAALIFGSVTAVAAGVTFMMVNK